MILLMWLVFIVLNGKWTLEIALIGLGVALLVFLFMCGFLEWSLKKEFEWLARLPRLILYAASMLLEIFKANLATLRRVYSRRPLQSAVVTLRPDLSRRWQRQMLANAITLTPGTITLECDDKALVVHCLDGEMADGLSDFGAEAAIRKMGD